MYRGVIDNIYTMPRGFHVYNLTIHIQCLEESMYRGVLDNTYAMPIIFQASIPILCFISLRHFELEMRNLTTNHMLP